MTRKSGLVYSPDYMRYDFGPSHVMRSDRFKLPYELFKAYEIPNHPMVREYNPSIATDEQVCLVHEKDYVAAVKALSEKGAPGINYKYALGFGDNPVFKGMYEASRTQVAGTILCCDLVMGGEVEHAFSLGGGLHHALRDRASGFCIFNDVAIGIRHLQREYKVKKIMYIDVDAHHGDGVQWIFYKDPGVLTVSLHENGRYLFPGTGFVEESGEGNGEGYSVNIPLPMQTHDDAYLHAFQEIVPPLANAYRPEIIVTQCGMDTHYLDPLTHLMLTTRNYKKIAKTIHELVHETTSGKWVAVGGGGYDVTVLSRGYTLVFSEMAQLEIPNEIPIEWMNLCRETLNTTPSTTLIDKQKEVVDTETKKIVSREVENIVREVKKQVFPYHGID